MTIESVEDILKQLETPLDLSLDCSELRRGIDNYHFDVEMSPGFSSKIRETVEQNLRRLISGKPMISGNSEAMIEVREAYTDLVRVTIHRTKTDLSTKQVDVLQFAVVKFVLSEIVRELDRYSEQLEETVGQQQYKGSRALLTTQERVKWFRRHRPSLYYRLTRHYLKQFQREENNNLKSLRQQMLGDFPEAPNIMFNPMLYGATPLDPVLLIDYYALWPNVGAGFEEMNLAIEAAFNRYFKATKVPALKQTEVAGDSQPEVYDELRGLLHVQKLLGPSIDQKQNPRESFSWLDHPGNIHLLFDSEVHARYVEAEGSKGFRVKSRLKTDLKKLQKIFADIRKVVVSDKQFRAVFASYSLREKLSQPDLDAVEIEAAIDFVAGLGKKKVDQVVDSSRDGALALQSKLTECAADFSSAIRGSPDKLFLRFLSDYSRYRLHLKYYRFAHRIFNRLSVVSDPEQTRLAKAGGHLYRLQSSEESKRADLDDEPEIIHHAILKADVRGSTTVTTELLKKELNPASYFSLRFFNPINESLKAYGAVKVFIEGDAVILGVYEYNNAPDEWFSVSRACGIAKEMLDIVNSKNAHSKQTGLPELEIGIGICYSDQKPLFLFDEDRPIMISSAIGDADRVSGCSWRLRKKYDPGKFNVGVFKFAEDDPHSGEKGQELSRYNVNGIVIDEAAFRKLEEEVHFTEVVNPDIEGAREDSFYIGRYPDVQGKQRDIVVRQGRVGMMCNEEPDPNVDTGLVFYEVLPNKGISSRILELVRN